MKLKPHAQKDGVNDLGCVFGGPSAENNSASEVQEGGTFIPLTSADCTNNRFHPQNVTAPQLNSISE